MLALAGFAYQFRPDVLIEPYASENQKDPFRAIFRVTNDWALSIDSVRYLYTVHDVMLEGNGRIGDSEVRPADGPTNLGPKESTSIYLIMPVHWGGTVKAAFESITISYRPFFFWERSKRVCFGLSRDVEGNYRWLPNNCARAPFKRPEK